MAKEIKRSMAVHPTPIVMEEGQARPPTTREFEARRHEGQWTGTWGYRITRVTNSVDFQPGWVLSEDNVRMLIDDHWTVTILTGE